MKKSTSHNQLKKLVLSAMFFAVGIVLPFLTGQIPEIGKQLLPMHLPVYLCGMICGWQYGLCVGALLPVTRSLWFGLPVLFPSAVCMSAELATYGAVVGLLYLLFPRKKKNLFTVYFCMIPAMIAGRILWGFLQHLILTAKGTGMTLTVFWTRAFAEGLPGIILQLVLIPILMLVYQKTKFSKEL